jgi:alcohol dehydrogenase YqhD (iron-dependent ADH family)
MDNFKFHVYTEIFFGKGEIKNLPSTLVSMVKMSYLLMVAEVLRKTESITL